MKRLLAYLFIVFGLGLVFNVNAWAPTRVGTINVGIMLGFTGPIERLTPAMADAAELAFKEASAHRILNGIVIDPIRADSTCINSSVAVNNAKKLVNQNVVAIMGADCSGVTIAIAKEITIPNGVVLVSPSATSPALTNLNDDGYFFRTAPSDARGAQVLAQVTKEKVYVVLL